MVVCGNLVPLEIRMGVQVGSRAARNFQARPVEERRYPAHAVVFRGCSAAWADLYSLPGFFAFVTAVDRMGCWSPCPAARQRRLLLRAGVVASGHVTALDPPRGPYLPREVSAAAAGPAEEAGPNRRAHSLLFRSRAIARGLRRQPYLLRRHPLPSRAAA
jgi:hypothetical protein